MKYENRRCEDGMQILCLDVSIIAQEAVKSYRRVKIQKTSSRICTDIPSGAYEERARTAPMEVTSFSSENSQRGRLFALSSSRPQISRTMGNP